MPNMPGRFPDIIIALTSRDVNGSPTPLLSKDLTQKHMGADPFQ